jgi:NAD(P)-dependent dehydrogenase (short-subunit alcohol dehydrogenase family)
MDHNRNGAQLGGKVAVVTGGTQGLGEAIARLFAERGVRGIVICGRNAERGAAVAADIARQGCRVEYVPADLAVVDDASSGASMRSSMQPGSPTAGRFSTRRRSCSIACSR